MPASVQGDCAPVTVHVTQATGIQPLSMLICSLKATCAHSRKAAWCSTRVHSISNSIITCTWSSADNNDQGPSLLMELIDHLVALGVFCAKAFALHDSKQYGLKVLLQEKTSQFSTVWCMA